MSDILLRDIPDEPRRKLEARARAHHRSLEDEAEMVLEGALSGFESLGGADKPGLGSLLSGLIPAEFRGDDFVALRDRTERSPPSFE